MPFVIFVAGDGAGSVALGDLNGDGALDLVSANFNSDNLTIFFQKSPGQFELDPNGPLEDPGLLDGPTSVTIGDLNGDGLPDLVTGNLAQFQKRFLNDGNGHSSDIQTRKEITKSVVEIQPAGLEEIAPEKRSQNR